MVSWRLWGKKPVTTTQTANTYPPEEEAGHRPIIGISGGSSASKSVAAMMAQVRAAGGEPRFIGEHGDRITKNGDVDKAVAHDLAQLDALVVMGNDGDIDPAKYGAPKDAHTKTETDLGRAAYEEKAIQSALDSGLPLLGICGGMQRINVLGGGTLYQNVPDIVGDNHHAQGDIAPFVPVQVVKITQGTHLGDIAGKHSSVYTPRHRALPPGIVMENSFHHQAVKGVRSDFRVSALSDDGIIEAIEPTAKSHYANQYVEAVQWHPEFGASDLGPKIVQSVTLAAKEYAASKAPRADTAEEQDLAGNGDAVAKILLRRQQNAVLAR